MANNCDTDGLLSVGSGTLRSQHMLEHFFYVVTLYTEGENRERGREAYSTIVTFQIQN